jgi:hypothetical protein
VLDASKTTATLQKLELVATTRHTPKMVRLPENVCGGLCVRSSPIGEYAQIGFDAVSAHFCVVALPPGMSSGFYYNPSLLANIAGILFMRVGFLSAKWLLLVVQGRAGLSSCSTA